MKISECSSVNHILHNPQLLEQRFKRMYGGPRKLDKERTAIRLRLTLIIIKDILND